MRPSSFGYLCKQGAKNVFINRMMSFACIGVMTACLLLIGFAISLSKNITSMVNYVEGQNEIVAFVREGVTEERCQELLTELSGMDNVAEVRYISKEEALASERENFGELAELLDGLEADNPLPASYRITLRDLNRLDQAIEKLGAVSELQEINAPVELSRTITALQRILFYAGSAVVIVLVVVTLIIIANTVKLTIFSRRREINIMKYCGATNTYIRLPYLIEGTIVGLAAALLSYGIVYILYERLLAWLTTSGGETGFLQSMVDRLLPFSELALPLAVIFLVFGCLLGLLGSLLFVKKYLKV